MYFIHFFHLVFCNFSCFEVIGLFVDEINGLFFQTNSFGDDRPCVFSLCTIFDTITIIPVLFFFRVGRLLGPSPFY